MEIIALDQEHSEMELLKAILYLLELVVWLEITMVDGQKALVED